MKTFSLKNSVSKNEKNWKSRFVFFVVFCVIFSSLHFFGIIETSITFIHTNLAKASSHVGFTLKEIVIEGHDRLKSSEILNDLNLVQKDPLFSFSLKDIQEKVTKNPWIRSVLVGRQLPSTIYLRIVERRPLALWKDERGITSMIDDEGDLIHAKIPLEYETLPTILGQNAHKHTPAIIKILQSFPNISTRVTGLVWVGERRWDLILSKKIQIQLPEDDLESSLKKLETLQVEHKIFEKSILKIDLRVQNKIILKPSPGASFNVRDGKVVGKKI
jgi:cell division protein FtsQ